jgi:phosphoribosylaminoimidazole-succinocarboxamide synthase
MIEAIARRYITGSMWRAYEMGEREFCGVKLPDNLQRDQRLPALLITPSTKGILTGIPGVPAIDDVNVSRADIVDNLAAFQFNRIDDVDCYERLLAQGFALIDSELKQLGQVFVDTKFEFGYVRDRAGVEKLIYMDEVGTPDSSRIWDGAAYAQGDIVENSKEGFRQMLLAHFADADILIDKNRMPERVALARDNELPASMMMAVSKTYREIAEKITGEKLALSNNPRQEIIDVLRDDYGLIDD